MGTRRSCPNGKPNSGCPSDLEREKAVSSLVNQVGLWWTSDRETTQNEWSCGEAEDLVSRLSLLPNEGDAFCLAELLPRKEPIPVLLLQNVARPRETIATSCVV